MGVPAFFRWLSRKYSSVIVECIEEMPTDVNGVQIPVDSSQPNPNGVEFDNLYLDMNGIIHPCTHPEDKPAPKNEDEMMIAIFECVDRLFRIVRPRKVLYMAIDGVAPCAKMNQQRSRRFRSSKESHEKRLEIARIREELESKGITVPPPKSKENHFDLNCITPGTEFMDRLSRCLHYYVHDRLNNDPGWKNVKVILSDAKVPGEGEHKIMDYIRRQRAQPDHDPNTQHVLCGADADLIMLGLATHEPNFTIIREEFKPNKPKPCDICNQIGHEMKECAGVSQDEPSIVPSNPTFSVQDQYIFVRLYVLREYLEKELQMPNLPFKYEFERAIDDWVFMCFFVGNDFLPHLPSLEIREGAIDRLVNLYKKTIYKTRGWLTESGDVNLDRVQMIMADLGMAEDEIFKKRQQTELMFKARDKARKRRERMDKNRRPNFDLLKNSQFAPTALGQKSNPVQNARNEAFKLRVAGMHTQAGNNRQDPNESRGTKRKADAVKGDDEESEEEDDQKHDEVRLWEDGFKNRYYESKFDVGPDNLEFRYNVALQYVKGLCWVLRYYYQGCASWKWHFPHHYAPFASDFINIAGLSTQFDRRTKPIKPMEQLMSVFPAASSNLVPRAWVPLMSDPDSPVIDFYPEDFKIDLNGKKFAWQGVALLPFVEEKRLFKALEKYYDKLTGDERLRNMHGNDRLYVGFRNPSYGVLKSIYMEGSNVNDVEVPYMSEGVRGTIMPAEDCVNEDGQLISPVPGLPHVKENRVMSVKYRDPVYPEDFIFPAVRLSGAVEPKRVLKPGDLSHEENRNYRPQIGMAPSSQRGYLGNAGHRMLSHHTPQNRGYANIQPPPGLQQGGYGGRTTFTPGGQTSYSGPDNKRPRYDQQQGSGYNRSGYNNDSNSNSGGGYSSGSRGGFSNNSSGYSSSGGGYQSSRGGFSNRGGNYGANSGRSGGNSGYQSSRGNYNRDNSNRGRSSQNQWGYGYQRR